MVSYGWGSVGRDPDKLKRIMHHAVRRGPRRHELSSAGGHERGDVIARSGLHAIGAGGQGVGKGCIKGQKTYVRSRLYTTAVLQSTSTFTWQTEAR
jgi:hypothetical protein